MLPDRLMKTTSWIRHFGKSNFLDRSDCLEIVDQMVVSLTGSHVHQDLRGLNNVHHAAS